jgi:hypothetical protein
MTIRGPVSPNPDPLMVIEVPGVTDPLAELTTGSAIAAVFAPNNANNDIALRKFIFID